MPIDPTVSANLKPADVPSGVVVQCPLHQIMVKPADTCFRCEHFSGIARLNPHESIPWEQRHLVLCRYRRKLPMQRVGAPVACGSGAAIGVATIKAR